MGSVRQIQDNPAAMRINQNLEMVAISEPPSLFLSCDNLRIQIFRHGMADAMVEIGQDIRQVPVDSVLVIVCLLIKRERLSHGKVRCIFLINS